MEGVISGSNIFRLLARTYVETEGKNRVAACRGQKHPLLPFTCFHEEEEKSGCQIEEIRWAINGRSRGDGDHGD